MKILLLREPERVEMVNALRARVETDKQIRLDFFKGEIPKDVLRRDRILGRLISRLAWGRP
jgi:hypothetical protein